MLITQQQSGSTITLHLAGRLDTDSSPALREAVRALPEGTEKLIFDLRDLIYLSSSGLREFLICRKQFPGDSMSIINVHKDVHSVFDITGFSSMMPVYAAEDTSEDCTGLSFKAFLEKKVTDCGDRTAVLTDSGSYTWLDIDVCSQIAAADLEKLGVGKGTHVGISCGNSINWIITFFAVQKLGAIAMLFNFSLFPHETAAVAVTGDVTHLCFGDMPGVKDEQEFEKALKASSPVKHLYPIGKHIDFRKRAPEYPELFGRFSLNVGADDPCTVIFTSGSTGKPKGVILSSYNILNAASASVQNQTLNENDRTCLILPMFHIFGLVAGLFCNFIADSLICLPKDIHTSTLLELIETRKCTVFHSVPTMLLALVNNREFSPKRCRTLRCTILSGSAATESQIRMFREKFPNEHFISSYGLSEMAPVSASDYGDTEEHLLHTVGKPVPNIHIKIQDHITGRDCLPGQQGEILVQGYNLMTGYYKIRPEDQSIDENGWLHTGDLGSLTEDGYLRLSGRLKELIIRGGENIMPGEVESEISAVEGVSMVKVLGVPSDFFGEEVCACVTMKEGFPFDEEQLRQALSGRLARFKIPAYFLEYKELPMLGTGKIDGVTLKKDMLLRLGK